VPWRAECAASYPRACLSSRLTPWSLRFGQTACSLRCCTLHHMRALRLHLNEQHWRAVAREMDAGDEDWRLSNLAGHSQGEILLGDMSYALLAHANVLALPRDTSPRVFVVPHVNESLVRTGQLIIYANSMPLTSTAISWLSHHLRRPHQGMVGRALAVRSLTVTLISRDDRTPSRRQWGAWTQLGSAPLDGRIKLRWFVQNTPSQANPQRMKASTPPVHSLPIGIHSIRDLLSFYRLSGGGESLVAQRSTLLMCCCMHIELPSRQAAQNALIGNGFSCEEENDSNSSADFFERTLRSRANLNRLQFYQKMMHAKFVASPAGYGRDCYRTWEALALGAVPVMIRGSSFGLDRTKFADLPVVWINDWKRV
ncbi:MAG: hypothetical protein SGPRY_012513, partial [Prymnesium sp.]